MLVGPVLGAAFPAMIPIVILFLVAAYTGNGRRSYQIVFSYKPWLSKAIWPQKYKENYEKKWNFITCKQSSGRYGMEASEERRLWIS